MVAEEEQKEQIYSIEEEIKEENDSEDYDDFSDDESPFSVSDYFILGETGNKP